MRKLFFFFVVLLFITSCDNEPPEVQQPEHFILEKLNVHLPFDQFNSSTKAIFRNISGEEFVFGLSIKETFVSRQFQDIQYTYNKIKFSYNTDFNFTVPNFSFETSLEYLTDLGYTEFILCGSSIVSASASLVDLTIIPGTDYQNTILNKEFSFMGEMFTDVYSNVLVEENPLSSVKIYFQSKNGIIGFKDNNGSDWIFDRFE